MQYDIQPGIFDPVSNQDIGSYSLNQWQHIKLDAYYPFLLSDIVLRSGTSIIPPSAYELAQDDNATAQEVGLSGDTLIGMVRITNISYAGTTLNITGNNFGTYVSNQATVDYVAAQVATRVIPSGANIAAGEAALFTGTSGLSIKTSNTAGVSAWGSGTNYTTAGTLARVEGRTYASTGVAGNLNKDPRLPENAPYWFTPPDDGMIEYLCSQGDPLNGGMHTVNDRGGANYLQRMKVNSKAFNSIAYDYWMVHLDDTQITGVTELENIFNVGAANEYPYLDKYAPDVLGTRTLIDMGDYVDTPQSSGGDADSLGGLVADQFQGFRMKAVADSRGFLNNGTADGAAVYGPSLSSGTVGTRNAHLTGEFVSDGVNSTPRTGSTTHGKRFTVGASYIIVKTPA